MSNVQRAMWSAHCVPGACRTRRARKEQRDRPLCGGRSDCRIRESVRSWGSLLWSGTDVEGPRGGDGGSHGDVPCVRRIARKKATSSTVKYTRKKDQMQKHDKGVKSEKCCEVVTKGPPRCARRRKSKSLKGIQRGCRCFLCIPLASLSHLKPLESEGKAQSRRLR
eukprot:1738426-Prymnesium_polylepis.1